MWIVRGDERTLRLARLAIGLVASGAYDGGAVSQLREAAGEDARALRAAYKMMKAARRARESTLLAAALRGDETLEVEPSSGDELTLLRLRMLPPGEAYEAMVIYQPDLLTLESSARNWHSTRTDATTLAAANGSRIQMICDEFDRNDFIMYLRIRRGLRTLAGPHADSGPAWLRTRVAHGVALAHLAHVAGLVPRPSKG